MSLIWRRKMDWTAELKQSVKELWEKGFSANGIVRELGLDTTRNAVIGIINRNGFSRPNAPPKLPRRRPARRLPASLRGIVAPRASVKPAAFLGISLLDLKTDQCRFPRGEVAPYLFCGQQKQSGSSYCPSCYRLTRNPNQNISQAERERRMRGYLKQRGETV